MKTVLKTQLKVFLKGGYPNTNISSFFCYNVFIDCVDNLVTSLVIMKQVALQNSMMRKNGIKKKMEEGCLIPSW